MYLRWNVNLEGQIAIGCQSNTIVLFSKSSKSQKILPAPSTTSAGPADSIIITDMQWDRLSSNYLLVSYRVFLMLWDTELGSTIHQFETQAVAITSIGWLDWTAGNFVTANNKNSHLKLWNASQKMCLDTVRFNGSSTDGIHSIYFCPGKKRVLCAHVTGSVGVFNLGTSQTDFLSAPGHTETIFDCCISPISPNTFCTASFDGTVKLWSVFDLSMEKVLHSQGEVIYSCDWSPKANMIVGSCSTGVIYVWEVDTGHPLAKYYHHKKPVFCVHWNRLLVNLIASTSGDSMLVVFDVESIDLTDNSNIPLASPSRRKTVNPSTEQFTDSNILFKYSHPAAVYGCSWCPTHSNVIVTGCHDGVVRVFNIVHGLQFVLIGHTQRAFGVNWSPILPGVLASGSDDHTVNIWKVTLNLNIWDLNKAPAKNDNEAKKLQSITTLVGHTNFVRALCWNQELAHLLISGSWDSTIRLWDTNKGVCLHVINDHIADVYSIVSHPERPFTYLSVSRDTTVRVWELDQLTALLRYKCLLTHDFSQVLQKSVKAAAAVIYDNLGAEVQTESIVDDSEESSVDTLTSEEILRGRYSSILNNTLSEIHCDDLEKDPIKLAMNYYRMYSYFTGTSDSMEVWENALSILTSTSSGTSSTGSVSPALRDVKLIRPAKLRVIHHESGIIDIARSEARKLESNKINTRKTDLSKKVEDQLRSSAMIYARIGDFQKYCSIMIDIGDWTAALAMAPSVSMEYWKDLSQRYSQVLLNNSSEESIPYLLAVGKDIDAVEFYLQRQDTSNAMLIAKMSELREDLIPDYVMMTMASSPKYSGRQNTFFKTSSNNAITIESSVSRSNDHMALTRDRTVKEIDDSRMIVQVVGSSTAHMYINRSRPILAAAQLLSIGDVQGSIQLLRNNDEYELAYALSLCFKVDCYEDIVISLADKMARLDHFELVFNFLRNSPNSYEVMGLLMSKYVTQQRAEALTEQFKLKPKTYWDELRKEEIAIGSDGNAVIYSVITFAYDDALNIAFEVLKRLVRTPMDLSIASKRLLTGLKHIKATTLRASTMKEFLLYLLWFTAHEAISMAMFDTAFYMLRIFANSMEGYSFPLSEKEWRFQVLFFAIYAGNREALTILESIKQNDHKDDSMIHDLLCDLLNAIRSAPNEAYDHSKQTVSLQQHFTSNKLVVDDHHLFWGDHTEAILR